MPYKITLGFPPAKRSDFASSGEVEFLFRHNALFFKTLQGGDPTSANCTYTGFGPNSASPPLKLKWTELTLTGKNPKKVKEPDKAVIGDSSGRPWLQVKIYDLDKDRHEYDIELAWTR